MRPTFTQIVGNELVVVWDDGHESYYPAEKLRRDCPCAVCSGEPDLFGHIVRGTPHYDDRSFELVAVNPVGNYALQLSWADAHDWGIWTFERLRAACPCGECPPQG